MRSIVMLMLMLTGVGLQNTCTRNFSNLRWPSWRCSRTICNSTTSLYCTSLGTHELVREHPHFQAKHIKNTLWTQTREREWLDTDRST